MQDPFQYPDKPPEWFAEIKREKRRAYMEKYLGRPIGKHGGYRKGAGRKKEKPYTHLVGVQLTRIQVMLLEDKGGIGFGIQKLIEEYL